VVEPLILVLREVLEADANLARSFSYIVGIRLIGKMSFPVVRRVRIAVSPTRAN
jgi:hypothetical protein